MFSRLLYRFMRAYGILKSDHEVFVERNGLELKGQFLGDTAPKVKRAVRDALGGCLFIDEAYALAEGGQDVALEGGDGGGHGEKERQGAAAVQGRGRGGHFLTGTVRVRKRLD